MSTRPPFHTRLISRVCGPFSSDSPAGKTSAAKPEVALPGRRHAPSGRIPKVPSARILIIDDDAHVAAALRRLLRQHQVDIALNGVDALACIRAQPFDVILSDVMMPRPSGIDVYRRLQREQSPLVSRFIFITGGVHDLESRWFLRNIPNACLSKPADPEELLLAIDTVLVRHGRPGREGAGSGGGPA